MKTCDLTCLCWTQKVRWHGWKILSARCKAQGQIKDYPAQKRDPFKPDGIQVRRWGLLLCTAAVCALGW
jgi:hypothetical protein